LPLINTALLNAGAGLFHAGVEAGKKVEKGGLKGSGFFRLVHGTNQQGEKEGHE